MSGVGDRRMYLVLSLPLSDEREERRVGVSDVVGQSNLTADGWMVSGVSACIIVGEFIMSSMNRERYVGSRLPTDKGC